MNLLLIHAQDALLEGPWCNHHWDSIADLGRSGLQAYQAAEAHFQCPVKPLECDPSGFSDLTRVRELLALGNDCLLDRFGLDWWELTAIFIHSELENVIRLCRFTETLGLSDHVQVSRAGVESRALEVLLKRTIPTFPSKHNKLVARLRHYVGLLNNFSSEKLVEIFWDKNDPGYQMRGRLSRRQAPNSVPVVLLPSAYGNSTRTGYAYAEITPSVNFLLVATRQSGWTFDGPRNVTRTTLKSYASLQEAERQNELADLLQRWNVLHAELKDYREFRVLSKIGVFDDFPRRFERGLQLRDAWRNVLDREPVQSVLCTDDSNPYTHIPLLLAKSRGLTTISCHHGALDGRYFFKRPHADVVLAKGRMEQDYLVNVCGLPAEKVEIGAPLLAKVDQDLGRRTNDRTTKPLITFFSECYEVWGGRGNDFYRDLLPPLADLALAEHRKLVIKLHPFESLAERTSIVANLLNPAQKSAIEIVAGKLQRQMLEQSWFGITVLSTAAVECAFQGLPCFLCKWLEGWHYGYVQQYQRFGIGIGLNAPADLQEIPRLLSEYKPSSTVEEDCGMLIREAHLNKLLGIGDRFRNSSSENVHLPEARLDVR